MNQNQIITLEHMILLIEKEYDWSRKVNHQSENQPDHFIYNLGVQSACFEIIENAIEYQGIDLDFAEWLSVMVRNTTYELIHAHHSYDRQYETGRFETYSYALKQYEEILCITSEG